MKERKLVNKITAKDKKAGNKAKIARFILHQGETSKQEISNSLGISMPTVLQDIKELVEEGIVQEVGEYQSTGGRKAKALSVIETNKYSIGIDLTANHIGFVLIDLKGNIIQKDRIRVEFENSMEYYHNISEHLEMFIDISGVNRNKILGVGVSIPGIIDKERMVLVKSHFLQVSNINLKSLTQFTKYSINFENDANCAAMAELNGTKEDAVYLSLSNSVGGSIYMNGKTYLGAHFRSAEFGHMIIETNGKRCYCGKEGCADAYCAAKVLSSHTDDDLDRFFELLNNHDKEMEKVWDEYLKYLAITVTNLRMIFDCKIILGGYVGGYMSKYMLELGQHALEYNRFENDILYLKNCQYAHEASAVGIALSFVKKYFDSLE